MPPINPNALSQFRSHVPATGKELTAALKTETVDNNVSVIRFFEKNALGETRGLLLATPSPVDDKSKKEKVLLATPEKLEEMKSSPEKFSAWLTEQITANKTYLFPKFGELEGAPTQYKFNNIVGQRIDQVLKEATKLATELYAAADARNKALYAVNTSVRDLYNRPITFDAFEVNGYASFGHDATFLHVYEKKLAELKRVDPQLLAPDGRASLERQKTQLQAEIDAIFRNKYVYDSGNMQEMDAEQTIGLVTIDARSRQRVSEVKETRESIVPQFEILNVQHENQNKAVYFDAKANKHYFDGTSQEVPAELTGQITRKKLSTGDQQNITFRRANAGEKLREGFRLDWNSDGYVQQGKIDWVSWGGHCNDKAVLEAAGVVVPQAHAGVYEYNSASGGTVHYERDQLNEMLMSFSELGSEMSNKSGGEAVSSLGTTAFAAARDDDRPDRLDLGNGRQIPFNPRPNEFEITKITKGGKAYTGEQAFREYIVGDNQMSAEKNPLYKNTSEGDLVNIDLSASVIEAKVKIQVFDPASGYPTTESKTIAIDFANPPAEPILVDSVMADAGKRELYEIRLDVQNKKWLYQKIRMEKEPNGTFKRVEVAGDSGAQNFEPSKVTGKRESSLDNPSTYLPFVRDVQKTGVSGTAETAEGSGVWNGRILSLGQALEKREGSWERVSIDVDARYGSNVGRYLAKLDAKGEPEFYVPLELPADFWWRKQLAFAGSKDSLANTTALARGVVTVEGGKVRADGLDDMLEVLHSAFNNRSYTIVHDGKRYFFDTKEAWQAEVTKLDQLRAGLTTGGTEPAPAPVTSELVKASDSVSKKQYKRYSFTAQVDGPITIKLKTVEGDADLYVKKGGDASASAYDQRSWKSGVAPDAITIKAKAGETYSLAVHGYQASKFEIEALGPNG